MSDFATRMAVPAIGRKNPDGAASSLRLMVVAVLTWIGQAIARSRQRRALAHLDDRLLADIGLTRCDAQAEVEKPIRR